MNNEIWKDIKGYEGMYQVSNMGNVRSADRIVHIKQAHCEYDELREGRIVKGLPRRHGYLAVFLYKDGQRRQESIHRLVAEAFCRKQDGDTDVNHKNENKTDNRASNLEWCTHKENSNYGTAQERRLQTCRERHSRWKAVKQFDLQGNFIAEYPSLAEMEKQTGYSKGNVCNALHGKYGQQTPYGFHWEYAQGNKATSL